MGWAGPLACRYLADLGADVLKIEFEREAGLVARHRLAARRRPDAAGAAAQLHVREPQQARPRPRPRRPGRPCGRQARDRRLATWCSTTRGRASWKSSGWRAPAQRALEPGGGLDRHAAVRPHRAAGGPARLRLDRRAGFGHAVRQRPRGVAADPAARGVRRPGGWPLRRGGGAGRALRPRAAGRRRHRALPGRVPVPGRLGRADRRARGRRALPSRRQPPPGDVAVLRGARRWRGGGLACGRRGQRRGVAGARAALSGGRTGGRRVAGDAGRPQGARGRDRGGDRRVGGGARTRAPRPPSCRRRAWRRPT